MANQSLARRWFSPRFPLEMAAASGLTLAVVATMGGLGPRAPAPSPAPAKTAAHAAPATPEDEARAAEFIQNFALAHVRAPLSEAELAGPVTDTAPGADTAPVAVLPPQREAVAVAQLARSKPRPPLPAARPGPSVKPPARPEDGVQVVEATPSSQAAPAKPASGFRIPFVSDVAAKMPSGRDILDGVGAVGRRIGGIFGRT